jgi:secreted Zn-dependent insulinase-like peptidase
MIYKTTYDYMELSKELELIGRCKIEKHLKELFIDSSLKIIIYGNIKKPLKLLKSKQFIDKSKLLYNKEEEFIPLNKIENTIIKHPNIIEKSNCVTFYYYIGNLKDQYENIILVLLSIDILADEFFNDLRTKKQLGYLVHMYYMNYRNDYYIVQSIQSDKPVDFIKDKIIEFNSIIGDIIKKANLNVFINTLKSKLLKPDNNMDEKYHKYLAEISSREYVFNRNELLAKELKNIELNKLITFTEKYINENNMTHVIIKGN